MNFQHICSLQKCKIPAFILAAGLISVCFCVFLCKTAAKQQTMVQALFVATKLGVSNERLRHFPAMFVAAQPGILNQNTVFS